jgi:hypothetical protein
MLKTIEQKTSNTLINGSSTQEANPSTVIIEAQRYLDFKYGKTTIDITLPDGATATLLIGNHGQAFFRLVSEA